MRVLLLLLFAVGCGRPNPDFCCVTEAQCTAADVEELRPCAVGQACSSMNTCVEKECETSADCASPGAPTCTNGLCVAGCSIDDDCVGVPGAPRCDSADGACVGCVTSDQCTEVAAALCDPETRQCRGCERDDECASGVCIEADGVCADEATVVYVREAGGADVGECTKEAPCRTFAFASNRWVAPRRVLRIIGGTLAVNGSIALSESLLIDGDNTIIDSISVPVFRATGAATIEGITVQTQSRIVEVPAGGVLRMFGVDLSDGELQTSGGDLEIDRSTLTSLGVVCMNSGLTLRRSHADRTVMSTENCQVLISRSHLGPGNLDGVPQLSTQFGIIVIENSLVVENRDFINTLQLGFAEAGSALRFSTFVSVGTSSGSLACLGTDVPVTSSIIAFNSTSPISNRCIVERSLFDLPGATTAMSGSGNESADVSTFFRDRASGDFHLDPDSPARGLGVPGLVAEDFDGIPRPAPSGSNPDSGAFEAP